MTAQRDQFERAVSEAAATAVGAALLGWNRLQACRRSFARDSAPDTPAAAQEARVGGDNDLVALLDDLVRTVTSRLRGPRNL